MKKSNVVILSVFLVLFTAVATYFLTTTARVRLGESVIAGLGRDKAEHTRQDAFHEAEELMNYILKNYYLEVSEDVLVDGMKKGIFEALGDPYSVFMTDREFESYMQSSSGEYPGIGIYLAPNKDNEIEIVAPIEDTPADKAGLMAKDLIVGVNGKTFNADMMDEAISIIKGEPGTSVTITIYRPSKDLKFDVEVQRAWIDIKVVKSRMLEDGIGYLRLSTFDANAADEFETHMNTLIQDGAKGVVLDLRQNPGGFLDQCVDIADMLLGKGTIVYTEGRNGEKETYISDAKQFKVALTVLVDDGSASASEILTGALKDYGAATIIGTKTFGKGIVQVIVPFEGEAGFKLTTSQYFTPNGDYIHGTGIEPDISVALDPKYAELEAPTDADDNQLQKAIEVLKEQLQ